MVAIAALPLCFARAGRLRACLVIALAATVLLTPAVSAFGNEAKQTVSVAERKGVRIEVLVAGETVDEKGRRPLVEDSFARFSVRISDSSTGRPISGLSPAGWLDLIPTRTGGSKESCGDKVVSFLGGGLFSAAHETLNRFFVLVLNGDGSISVVDPQFQFGGSRLLTMVTPATPAVDWAVESGGRRVWLALPESKQVTAVDTFSWEISKAVDLAIAPTNVLIQPGTERVWAVGESDGKSELVVLDSVTGKLISELPLGTGPHEMIFEADGRFAVVTNFRSGTVTVVDAVELTVQRTESLTGEPVSISWSGAANAAVISDRLGKIFIIDPEGRRKSRTVAIAPGIGQVTAAPDVPYAVVLHPAEKRIYAIDLATAKVVHSVEVLGTPDEVSFSEGLVYVHHSDDEKLFVFPIPNLSSGRKISSMTIPSGQRKPGAIVRRGSVRAVTRVIGENSVLVAAPSDRSVYYYREGMAAPMGNFKNYGRVPVGVMVIDRSFRETGPGTYETVAHIDEAGRYDLVFWLDSPSIVECFPFAVEANAARVADDEAPRFLLSWGELPQIVPRKSTRLRLSVVNEDTGEAVSGITDLVARVTQPGRWQRSIDVTPAGNTGAGLYDVPFTPPDSGLYIFFFSSISAGFYGERTLSLHYSVVESGGQASRVSVAEEREP